MADKKKTSPEPKETKTVSDQKTVLPKPEPMVEERVVSKKLVKEKTLLSWESPLTVYKHRDREFFTTAGAIAFLVTVILFFLKEWFLIIFIIAFFFYTYVMSTTPPPQTSHQITNRAITTGGKSFYWDELTTFWFTERFGQKALNVGRFVGLPRQLIMMLGDKKETEVREVMTQFLEEEAPAEDFFDRSSRWLSKKIPFEK